jgi:hypothetical protein
VPETKATPPMKKAQNTQLSNSILHRQSGKMIPTTLTRVNLGELRESTITWEFSWEKEASKFQVFKLTTVEAPSIIQGLISLELRTGFCFVSLVESAPHNRRDYKQYEGVGGNLFAFACKLSFENGYDGIVVFETKTELKAYYKKSFGAIQIGSSNRMYLDENAAKFMVKIYFN